MKRIIISLLLLIIVFLMSEFFVAEANTSAGATTIASLASVENKVTTFPPAGNNFIQPTDCACGASNNPTLALVLLAAVASWLAMATFIYGSHFIATLVAG